MIESWSEKIAYSIKKANEEQTASIPVLKFALIILFNFTIPIIISLVIGAILGLLGEVALAATSFILLRMASGGYHFKSSSVCMLTMIIVAIVPPLFSIPSEWVLICNLCSLTLVAILAPSNMRGYNNLPEKYYPFLKTVSLLLVASNFYLGSDTMALVFLIQGISLLKFKEV